MHLSEILGRAVVDSEGLRLGNVDGVVAALALPGQRPRVVALRIKAESVPIETVVALDATPLQLRQPRRALAEQASTTTDLDLAHTVLDRQVIDLRAARAVRVNDVELAADAAAVWVTGVDIGGAGLLRRLGLGRVAEALVRRDPATSLAWENIQLITPVGASPLSGFSSEEPSPAKLADLPAADRAEILGELAQPEGQQLLERLDAEAAANTLEAMEPDFQAHLVDALPDDQAVKIVEAMAPDEAADLLTEMPVERRAAWLDQLSPATAQTLRRLLAYPPGTAGSLMRTDFVAVPLGLTAGQTLGRLREAASEADTLYYVYVTDPEQRLVGVLALSDLVLAQPNTPMTEFMRHRVIWVHVRDSQGEVAQIVAKYHLLAVPVVDDGQHLVGMITRDDALSELIPASWKRHRRQRFA